MIEQPLEPSSIAFAVAIMAMGSALQASAGVGLALFVVPLLALVDRSLIPGPTAILLPGVAIGLAVAPLLARRIDGTQLRLIILGIATLEQPRASDSLGGARRLPPSRAGRFWQSGADAELVARLKRDFVCGASTGLSSGTGDRWFKKIHSLELYAKRRVLMFRRGLSL
jgi:hypothetical protein